MKILIIGGTGAMGAPLTKILGEDRNNSVTALARKRLYVPDLPNVNFIQGNAFDSTFMSQVIQTGQYDVIVDFMIYSVNGYKDTIEKYMSSCKQYVCISSASVYACAPYKKRIIEETPRLYDSYSLERRQRIDIYHILKSQLDDILFQNKFKNWTLIRPYITFNKKKIPLVTWPKEVWLYRYINNKKIVLPKDAMSFRTTVSYGEEVAKSISALIGRQEAIGEIINVASYLSLTWKELLEKYEKILPKICGKKLKIFWVEKSEEILHYLPEQYDLFVNDRLLDREFDTSKLDRIAGKHIDFSEITESLSLCISGFLSEKEYKILPDPVINGYMDKITHEHTPLSEFNGKHLKILYLVNRYNTIGFMYRLLRKIKKGIKRCLSINNKRI